MYYNFNDNSLRYYLYDDFNEYFHDFSSFSNVFPYDFYDCICGDFQDALYEDVDYDFEDDFIIILMIFCDNLDDIFMII